MKRIIVLCAGAMVWSGCSRSPEPAPALPATVSEFKQMPGGAATIDAGEYLIGRLKEGKLPGISKDDHGSMVAANAKPHEGQTESYPLVRVIVLRKNGDTSEYFYGVVRESAGAPWQLQKAWRANPEGKVVEEYPVQ